MASPVQPEVIAIITCDVKPERLEEFYAVMKADALGSRTKALDPGCISFNVFHSKDPNMPNRFYFYEAYAKQEDQDFHKQTEHFKGFAKFKESGGVEVVSAEIFESASITGRWGFNANTVLHSQADVGVFVHVEIKEESLNDFFKAMEVDAIGSRCRFTDPGALRFDVIRSKTQPNKFIFVEAYLNAEAQAFHKSTSHYKAWSAFKEKGGVASQVVVQWDTTSMPGTWGLQCPHPGVEQPTVASVLKVVINPEKRSVFEGVAAMLVNGARNKSVEAGCVRFDLIESSEAADTFFIYRAFATPADLEFHFTTAHYQAWVAFAASGIVSQEETILDVTSIEGGWAFQADNGFSSKVAAGTLVTIDVKADRTGDFLKAMHVDAMGSRNCVLDPGAIRFDLLHDSTKPNRYHFFEAYSSVELAAHHKTTAHYKAWAQFKASGGVEAQAVQKWHTCAAPLPGFQSATVPLGAIEMPLLGFGCYKVGVVPASATATGGPPPPQGPEVCDQIMRDAIESGYRMFDSAQFYMNEHMIGDAIKKSGVARERLFITSKVWNDIIYKGADAVKAQVDKAIAELQCDYLDLCLVHWPVPGKHVEAYQALRACKAAGKVKEIGISNYTIEDFEELRSAGGFESDGTDKPVLNQFEVNPHLFRKKTIEFFQKEGVHVQSYRGLMQANKSWGNPVLQEVCAAVGRPPAQVLGRFLAQQGISHIPKASNTERMCQNAGFFGFSLSKEHMDKLSGLMTTEALDALKPLYVKCIWRDTPEEGSALPGDRTWE